MSDTSIDVKAIQAALALPVTGELDATTWQHARDFILEHTGLKPATGPRLLTGDGTWLWSAKIDGADIVVSNIVATAFGGDGDSGDNGLTASGIPTRGNPDLIACALPMSGFRNVRSTQGSPIPRLPWLTIVEVTDGSTTILCPVIDIGPSKASGHALDLTVAAAKCFDPNATANNFEKRLSYRIHGGAHFA